MRNIELRLARGAKAVGVIAENFRRIWRKAACGRLKMSGVGATGRTASSRRSRGRNTRTLRVGESQLVRLHGGNMGQKQGLDNLLDAAELLRDTDVRIALVGDGNHRARLEREAHARGLANVDFIGMQMPGEWEAILEAADVLIRRQRASVTDMSLPRSS